MVVIPIRAGSEDVPPLVIMQIIFVIGLILITWFYSFIEKVICEHENVSHNYFRYIQTFLSFIALSISENPIEISCLSSLEEELCLQKRTATFYTL